MKAPAVLLVPLVLLAAACVHDQQTPVRPGEVTLRGKPVTLVGDRVGVGDDAPDFVAVAQDMSDKRLSDYAGKTVILSVVPSVDTKVCAIQTRTFNEKASALGEDVVILTVSMDLPMAQKRFCAAEGIDRVVMLSDFRYWDFAEAWGLRIKESGLLARALYVIDTNGKVVHGQIVPELTDEPDYDAALEAVRSGPRAEASGASALAKLPERFAGLDPANAAQRGPRGIGEARDVFHELLANHGKIHRVVQDIPGGVRTVTTSDDPEIAGLIRLHVRQMAARYEAGMPVRRWDPLFAELLKHFDKITMTIDDIPAGLRVTQTSDDPQVALLIRQHAHRGVSEFVERGFDRAHEASPMPEGYEK
ncbi:MAG: thiol peroxidase [Phycisphaeraceae bacterium]